MNDAKKRLIHSRILLTIGILVSNRKEYIRKCMESIKPILSAIPSELIAVDTVGPEATDGSMDIVREYTDLIYPFKWCNDFAAARNVCIEHARGEWFMYLDDDEWFDDVSAVIDFFKSGESLKYMSGCYGKKNYMADGTVSDAMEERMIRLRQDTHFVGKIHESFNEIYLPCKYFSTFVHHMGYYFLDDAARAAHFDRNMSLLMDEFAVTGYEPGLCAQIVQEYMGSDRHQKEGIEFCRKSIEELEKDSGRLSDPSFQWLLCTTVRYEANNDNYAGVRDLKEKLFSSYPLSTVTKAAITCITAGQAAKHRDLDTFFDNLMTYLSCYDAIWADPDAVITQVCLDFPKFYGQQMCYDLLWYGAAFANGIGEYSVASMFWKRFDFEHMDKDTRSKYAGDLNDTINGLKGQTVS